MPDADGTPLRKLKATVDTRPDVAGAVSYAWHGTDGLVELGPYIGRPFRVRATGILSCAVCGRRVKKFYGQGFCFPCLRDAPEASECIVRPELCRAHLGEGRDVSWEREHHDKEHVVYLSWTGGLKVGVTRATQVPVRWVDQGAVAAVAIARLPYRQLAGQIEVELKQHFSDRTNWRAMLRNVAPSTELLNEARDKAISLLAPAHGDHVLPQAEVTVLHYPVVHWPPKVVSVQLERAPLVEGRLAGIKGQYLIWEDGRVLNVRNHTGYHVEVGGTLDAV
jgi:hypothetical protein